MARTMALCSLPRTNPGNRHQYKRVNGPYRLYMQAGPETKLPFGNLRVIVKSGVWKIDSSGGLIDVCHFDSIVEFHSSNHLGQIIEPS